MTRSPPVASREMNSVRHSVDLVVVGGGMAGCCAAITAARAGIRVVLVQDRPVLGGNGSSEIRLWILGATSHMGNNNRWAREGGVFDEIAVENLYRNREGNTFIFDSIVMEKVVGEANITLLLNTAAFALTKGESGKVEQVRAFCSQNSTLYELSAPLFCDASGDGVIAFLAGGAFRMGAEAREEFDEKFATTLNIGEMLGHSLYFYSKDVGHPVPYIAPAYSLKDITKIPRYRSFNATEHGCFLWWIEFGGRLDTVHGTEDIKWELWKVVYGVWDYIKNSGKFPEAANLTLEWVGAIPGKRESRRFEGDYILVQQDIVAQREHYDAVAYGGWSIDLHPAEGVYSPDAPCQQWHAKGVYQIPYRCYYSKNVPNLFLAGRIISTSHVAFGSSRVIATCALGGQAVGLAAALCRRHGWEPRDLGDRERIPLLQQALLKVGHYIPGFTLQDPDDLARSAKIKVSSEYILDELAPGTGRVALESPWAMMLPVTMGSKLNLTVWAELQEATELRVELRTSSRLDNHTPDQTLETRTLSLAAGAGQELKVSFAAVFAEDRYAFVCFFANKSVALHTSEVRVTGVLSLKHGLHSRVAKTAVQKPPPESGIDSFDFWLPQRRPGGQNIAVRLDPPLRCFGAENLSNGISRPTRRPNAWAADLKDAAPTFSLSWDDPQELDRIELSFDPDYDHPLESVFWLHPESTIPFCIKNFRIKNDAGVIIAERQDNHQARASFRFSEPVVTKSLTIELEHPSAEIPAALFEVRCYAAESAAFSS